MAGRKIEGEQEARQLLEEMARSSTPSAVFARSKGIDGRSLNAWRMTLRRAEQARVKEVSPLSLQIVELVPTNPHPKPMLTVRCGPFTIDVPKDFDQEGLSRLLVVVAEC